MLADPATRRASIAEGVRADFAHFVSHGRKWVEGVESHVKEVVRQRIEKLKKLQLAQMRLQKEEQKKEQKKELKKEHKKEH